MTRRRPLAIAAALVAGLIATTASPVAAAPGDVTTTTFTPPASVGTATLALAFNNADGGTYQVYRSGQTRTMIRTLATGAVDTAFNNGTPVSIGVATALQTSGTIRVTGTTHAGTKKWWVVTGAQLPSDVVTQGFTITSGDSKGTVDFTKNITGATLKSKCEEFIPNTMAIQNPSLLPRRNGGAWLSMFCGSSNSTILVPLTAAGEIDSTSKTVSAVAAHGATASCTFGVRIVADPTSKAPAPELWILRTEHNFLQNSICPSGGNIQSSVASNFVALAGLTVSENGTVTRTQLSTSTAVSPGGMRVDPGGRVVALVTELANNSKVKVMRLKADGSLDTTVGTSGFRDLDTGALPTGATVLNTSILGLVTTADKTYFVVTLSDSETNSYMNNVTTPRVHGFRMGLMSPTDGWATAYGTGGIGQRATTTLPENWFNNGGITATGFTVDSKGQPVGFIFTETSTTYNVWATITGATGGGEGGTGLGGFTRDTGGAPSAGQSGTTGATTNTTTGATTGRVDATVYARLPATVQVNTAFNVLSASAARAATLVSNTRTTCVVSGRQVIAVGTGRCTVVVNSKSDGTTLRTLRTRVTRTASTKGSQVTVGDPILFTQASARLSKKARTQIAAIAAAAAGAKSIVVVGHAAALTESPFNFAISRNRANAVRDALRRAKVKSPITVTWRGTLEQVSTTKTEVAQARNRRVVVYLVP